jgi:NADH-quinone oxidoreductase subunit M
MITHGISTGALFILAGTVYERIHTRDIQQMGGFWHKMPFMGTVALIFAMASLGLPGLGNFIAEFLTLVGSWQATHKLTILAAIGLVAATAYSLRIMQKIFYGKELKDDHKIFDLSLREKIIFVPLVIVIVWLGFFPQLIINTASKPVSLSVKIVSDALHKHKPSTAKTLIVERKGGSHE